MMKKIETPVLFDACIIFNLEGNLELLFNCFENIYIHDEVYQEIRSSKIKSELDKIASKKQINYVNDIKCIDDEGEILERECKKELNASFNINKQRDKGEYSTLLYAKFGNVLLSSQDTTVWRFVTDSKYFAGIQCITMQDLAYYMYLNAEEAKERKFAKKLYECFCKEEHPFSCFEKYMKRHNDIIPKYIEFENERIDNFYKLINEYLLYYRDTYSFEEIAAEIACCASADVQTCTSCLNSRMDKNIIDFNRRICKENYSLNDINCVNIRDEFKKKISERKRK